LISDLKKEIMLENTDIELRSEEVQETLHEYHIDDLLGSVVVLLILLSLFLYRGWLNIRM
jgi:hypothetical protein